MGEARASRHTVIVGYVASLPNTLLLPVLRSRISPIPQNIHAKPLKTGSFSTLTLRQAVLGQAAAKYTELHLFYAK